MTPEPAPFPQAQTSDDLRGAITQAVRFYMTLQGWTRQKDLAEWLGWSEAMVSRKLKGSWDLDDLSLLAERMGIGPGDFFRDPEALVALLRSRCFAPLSLVSATPGQMELSFEPRPELVGV